MSTSSNIEWTDATWNPTAGCDPVSPGCLNCYAAKMAHRLESMGQKKYLGLTVLRNDIRTFSGKMTLDQDSLDLPLHWKKPRRIFVDSMSDLFHKDVPFEFVDKVFAVMAICPQHTFQILTKRPQRMAEYFGQTGLNRSGVDFAMNRWYREAQKFMSIEDFPEHSGDWDWTMEPAGPLDNVWLGTSVENQKCADERIPHLLKCPAAVRFLSVEPLLGPVDLTAIRRTTAEGFMRPLDGRFNRIHWVIVGGESGPDSRPMRPQWARSIRDQCKSAGVAFFFKQWGEFIPTDKPWDQDNPRPNKENEQYLNLAGGSGYHGEDVYRMKRVGKHKSGRLLDGVEYNEMPTAAGNAGAVNRDTTPEAAEPDLTAKIAESAKAKTGEKII